jgi:hypothetical protein
MLACVGAAGTARCEVMPAGLAKAQSTPMPAAHSAATNDDCQVLATTKSSMTRNKLHSIH